MKLKSLLPAWLRAAIACTMTVATVAATTPLKVAAVSHAVRVPTQTMPGDAHPPSRALVGEIEVVVQLTTEPLAQLQAAALAKQQSLTHAQQVAHVQLLKAQQNALLPQLQALGGREVARLNKALNAVVIAIDAQRLPALRQLAGVRSARPVRDYEMSLSETVDYVGGKVVHDAGFTGQGMKIAVLDSGIDYTHAEFGGPGTTAAYQAAYGTGPGDPRNTTRDGLFPTAKVIEGHDFVGEAWPNGPRTEDTDPIDFEGHGTHVADIAAGKNGMAPGAKLYAVKVCSAVASSCNGVALLLGVDYALNPSGDDAVADAVDVMNLSLGSSYGQQEDDLTEAIGHAVELGVVAVVAAGNSGDRPYIVSSPSIAPGAISVAQTEVPGSKGFVLKVDHPTAIAGGYHNARLTDWAPLTSLITGELKRPPLNSAGAGLACAPLAAHFFDNKIALIDRGSCAFSDKVSNAALAGAIAVIIVNNVPGEALPLGQSTVGPTVPTISVGQEVGAVLEGALATSTVTVTLDPAAATSLAGSIVASSARGPSYSLNTIKPDIGAPGASVSAEVGTGTGSTAFGGTSGATPVVTGAAALVKQVYPTLAPFEIKARLVNTAETEIFTTKVSSSPQLAPITRIGGGEVRIDRAIATKTVAWEQATDRLPSLSFGYQALNAGVRTLTKMLVVHNVATTTRTYSLQNQFRYADDAASGAVTMTLSPSMLTVPANGFATANVTLTITPTLLPAWSLNGGARGGDGFRLQSVEFDGYVNISDATDEIHVPWQVLPHRSAAVRASTRDVTLSAGAGSFTLTNASGATSGAFDVFSLLGTSPRTFTGNLPVPGDNFAFVDLQSFGVRLVDFGGEFLGSRYLVDFAITTYDQRAHPAYPGGFQINVDTNNDGIDDYAVFNQEQGSFATTGVTLTWVVPLHDPTVPPAAYFATDADLNSADLILTVPAGALGVVDASAAKNIMHTWRITVLAFDDYFTGNVTDVIANRLYNPGLPRYVPSVDGGSVPIGGAQPISVTESALGAKRSPGQTGILLLYRDARAKMESEAIRVSP